MMDLFGTDFWVGFGIILNLIVIESLLSVDNAAVLATMVMDLPKDDRKKALRYGIIGAYAFRGICLLVASWLAKIWWLKAVGGVYLLILTYQYFKKKSEEEDDAIDKEQNWFYKKTIGLLGTFWATVAIVELMDLAFSIDNVFAAVAFTNHLGLIYIGVFIGILAMRFVAQAFVKLMEKFVFLETVAFIVIGVLGLKLLSSLFVHFDPHGVIAEVLEGKHFDLFISLFTVVAFGLPILTSWLFNFPKNVGHAEVAEDAEEVLDQQ